MHPLDGKKIDFTREREIDLLQLLSHLYAAKKLILTGVLFFALTGLVVSFFLPQKWSSQAIIIPAEIMQWQEMQQQLVKLQTLGIDTRVTRGSVFRLFIKTFESRSLLEEFLTSSPGVQAQLRRADSGPDEVDSLVVSMAKNMKSASNQTNVGPGSIPYSAWTLSFVAATPQDAQSILEGYINYVSEVVNKEVMQNIRNAVSVKRVLEEGRLAQKRVQLENLRSASIERLNYALKIAKAAGIKKPVYSNGLAGGDDPDYPVTLGSDGIAQKLAIEKSITSAARIDVDFNNELYELEQLQQTVIPEIHFGPFKYQLSPSMPLTKDNPGKGIIVLLAAALGGLLTCTVILLRLALAPPAE